MKEGPLLLDVATVVLSLRCAKPRQKTVVLRLSGRRRWKINPSDEAEVAAGWAYTIRPHLYNVDEMTLDELDLRLVS